MRSVLRFFEPLGRPFLLPLTPFLNCVCFGGLPRPIFGIVSRAPAGFLAFETLVPFPVLSITTGLRISRLGLFFAFSTSASSINSTAHGEICVLITKGQKNCRLRTAHNRASKARLLQQI